MRLEAGWRGLFATMSLVFAVSVPVFLAVAATLTRYDVVDYKFGFGVLTVKVGLVLSILALVFSLVAVVIAFWKAPRKKAVIIAGLGLAIASTVAGRAYFSAISASVFPPIHDVQTNWDDPVHPSDYLVELRSKTPDVNLIVDNPILGDNVAGMWPEFVGQRVAQVQEQSEVPAGDLRKSGGKKPYPTIQTLVLNVDESTVFDLVLVALNENGWDIVPAALQKGRIEATVTSPWFGFKDDVMIRIRSESETITLVDIRSVSRVGISDLGANAKRVYELSRQLKRLSGDDSFN